MRQEQKLVKEVVMITPQGKRPKNWIVIRCRDGNKRAYNTPYWLKWAHHINKPDEFWCAHCGYEIMRGHLAEHVCKDGSHY